MRLVGLGLIVLGILAVVYGGFWYSHDRTKFDLGPLQVKVEERDRVTVPLWAGIGAIVVGGVLVAMGRRGHLVP